MIFAILTLISALSISCIAAYFSIIGLATIFPGSIQAVIAMGVALEVGKIIAAIWLHNNWKSAPRTIKIYLFSAIIVLMGITSMGIFGFLSKSHIEHEANAERNLALAAQVENKIKREKDFISRQKELINQTENSNQNLSDKSQENIKLEQQKIEQLNSQLQKDIELDSKMLNPIQLRIDKLNEELNAIKNKPGGIFSNKKKEIEQVISDQANERADLNKKKSEIEDRISKYRNQTSDLISDIRKRIQEYQSIGFDKPDEVKVKIEEYNNKIAESLNKIDDLEKEKFNYDDGSRQLEAEVGPIKYVAELISDFTGIQFDMGKAVRIVIIILIFVFDPLAVLLVLAAHISLMKRFPGLQIDETKVITKNAEIKILSKELEEKESRLNEKKKDLDQEEKIVELKESQINLYKEEMQKYKESSRRAKIEAEEYALELERRSPIKEEINELEKQKNDFSKQIENLKKSKKKVLDQANKFQEDIIEIKKIAIHHKDNAKSLSDRKREIKSCEEKLHQIQEQLTTAVNEKRDTANNLTKKTILINQLEQDLKNQDSEIKELKLQNSTLESQNKSLSIHLEQISNSDISQSLAIKSKEGKHFTLLIKSKKSGTHKFQKEGDFSEPDILNLRAICAEIDLACPQQETPLMQKIFESSVKKYLNHRLDNRAYKKEKPIYKFIP